MSTPLDSQTARSLIEFALKFGIDAALELAKGLSGGTIEGAIAALEAAKTKTAQQYLDEAKAKAGGGG
jgi:hypothetical protein